MLVIRYYIPILLLCLCVAPAGAQQSAEQSSADHALVKRIDASLARAGKYLLKTQADDGAWYSDTYGALRTGPTMTPYVMSGFYYLPQAGPKAKGAYQKGVDYLAGFVKDGRLNVSKRELFFPVYTAASASRVVVLLDRNPRNLATQQAWLTYLRSRQLNESLGWKPSDPEYGGWGFSLAVPRKPKEGQLRERFFESNLTATIFGIAALRSAKVPADDPAYKQALVFVKRCQNFSDDPKRRDERFDDGGFFFMPGDPLQNKAGPDGKDRFGVERFRSYGTMTGDGLRGLLRCGLPPDHPRVVAAKAWLVRNFSATKNPGTFTGDRAVLQNATYYYWTWAVAHCFMALRLREIDTPEGRVAWAEVLAEELLRRQRPDGTWVNRFTDAKEDDPLVSTPWAAAALAICRATLTGQRVTIRGKASRPH